MTASTKSTKIGYYSEKVRNGYASLQARLARRSEIVSDPIVIDQDELDSLFFVDGIIEGVLHSIEINEMWLTIFEAATPSDS